MDLTCVLVNNRMTKKSSFLRQLNLYGFNRLSGQGPDQGSYYHEKFLRNLKFLCRRMKRNKVNGNRIRAAGNPDEEPVLANYPRCPPFDPATAQQHLATAAVLQLMASRTAHAAPSPASHLSTLMGLVPGANATSHLAMTPHVTSPAPNTADVTTSILARQSVVKGSTTQESQKPLLESSANSSSIGKSDRSSPALSAENKSTGSLATLAYSTTSFSNRNAVSFPLKLQRILDKLESEGHQDSIMSWLAHGRAFMVHDPQRLVSEVMPLYFNQTKYSSFQRQLHMYNFQRITTGRDKGAYYHPKFMRGHPSLCQSMERTRVNGKGTRQPGNPDAEPNLYQLPPLPNISKVQPSSLSEQEQSLQPPQSKTKDLSAPSVSSSSATAESDNE